MNEKTYLKIQKFLLKYRFLPKNLLLSLLMVVNMTGCEKNEEVSMPAVARISQINLDYPIMNVSDRVLGPLGIEFEIKRELSYEDKMCEIMEKYGLTYEQLDTVLAGCCAEAAGSGTNYDDAYAVASTIFNRTRSTRWVSYIDSILGNNAGSNIYYQFVAPSQFSVYESGAYKRFLGRIDLIGYQAAIDMFYTEEANHNYLSFRSNETNLGFEAYRVANNGNQYFNNLPESDIIDKEQVLVRTK